MTETTAPFRLPWKETDLGSPPRTDFCAKDQGKRGAYCRIYKAVSSPTLGWFWTASDGHRDLGTGYAPTAREAARRAEAVYFGGETAGASQSPAVRKSALVEGMASSMGTSEAQFPRAGALHRSRIGSNLARPILPQNVNLRSAGWYSHKWSADVFNLFKRRTRASTRVDEAKKAGEQMVAELAAQMDADIVSKRQNIQDFSRTLSEAMTATHRGPVDDAVHQHAVCLVQIEAFAKGMRAGLLESYSAAARFLDGIGAEGIVGQLVNVKVEAVLKSLEENAGSDYLYALSRIAGIVSDKQHDMDIESLRAATSRNPEAGSILRGILAEKGALLQAEIEAVRRRFF